MLPHANRLASQRSTYATETMSQTPSSMNRIVFAMDIRPTVVSCFLCLLLVLLVPLLITGCGASPKSMADEMCDCISENGAMECMSLSQEHREALQDDREAQIAYRQALMQCQ